VAFCLLASRSNNEIKVLQIQPHAIFTVQQYLQQSRK
jgi:hypothetical protein